MPLLQDGQIIRETYEVERFLGEGAFAEVYRVKHRYLDRREAMKVFKLLGMTIEEIKDLLSEANLLSRFEHPNIVKVFEGNVTEASEGKRGFFTMEYVAGGSLERFWQAHGDRFVPTETVVEILRQICRGLAVAHLEKPPIVHRDIKPQNVLVGYSGEGLRVRVSDFGLAKRVNPLTLLVTAQGTRSFKSPEVFRDPKGDSCAGDVWALGCVLYLLLTDRLPFSELNETDLIDYSIYKNPLIPPSRLNPNANPILDQITFRCLALDSKDRYKNANDLLADLNKWKPSSAGDTSKSILSSSVDITKTALGIHSPVDEDEAKRMVVQALQLSRHAEKLNEASDLMEEAFNKWPKLRSHYEYKLKLWRKGIIS